MCGRFSLGSTSEAISKYFGVPLQLTFNPLWNVAPGQDVLTIKITEGNTAISSMLHWGLIPPWAKDQSAGYKMINARAETVHEKSSFKAAFRKRRCLIVANGFYEWRRTDQKKSPYHIRKTDLSPFAFAGIWERWVDKQTQEVIESCAMLTTEPNDLLRPIHTRMPVILEQGDHEQWMCDKSENLGGLLRPRNWSRFEVVPVSDYVNNARNEGVRCIKPIG